MLPLHTHRGWLLVGITALLTSACAPGEELGQVEQASTFCPTGPTLNGIDVSNGNGAIDWMLVHGAGYDFAIMKATQGTGYTDARFAANWSGAHAAGVVRGAYHFFDPTVDGVVQANHFLAVMGTLTPGDLPPMLDVECPDGDPMCLGYAGGSGTAPAAMIRTRMLDWLHTVQAATGRTPMIYTFPSYFTGSAIDTTGMAAYPLFIANLATTACYTIPAPWTTAAIRQYDWHGMVAGVGIPTPTQVDRDYFYGTLGDLMSFGVDAGAPVDASTPDVTVVDATSTDNGVAETGSDASLPDAGSSDAVSARDAVSEAVGDGGTAPQPSGCGCTVPAGGHARFPALACTAVGALLVRRRRRARGQTSSPS